MATYSFTITNVPGCPLLMNRNSMGDEKEFDGGKAGDDRTPANRWMTRLFHDGERIVVFESMLKACLEKAGAKIATGGKQTLKVPVVAGLFFDQAAIPMLVNGRNVSMSDVLDIASPNFVDHESKARELGFYLDGRTARMKSGSSHFRVRPAFPNWSITGTFDVDEDFEQEMTEARLRKLFDIAGKRVGIGDWRPSAPKRPGSFGRFTTVIEAC